MENTQSKGMSKGCMIGLIVGGAILVIVIVGLGTCWYYKDDLAKMGAATVVEGFKTELGDHQYEDVDTVQFNAMADAFLERLDQQEPLEWEPYGAFMQSIQNVMADQQFTADEVPGVIDAFVQYFPDLEAMRPTAEEPEPAIEEDSLSTE
jgi:hypothetical protein